MKNSHIAIVSIPVTDQERAKAFYTEILDFVVVRDAPFDDGMRWIEVAPPGATTTLALVTWFPAMPPGGMQGLVLETVDVDAAYATLQERGLQLTPLETAPWGRFATFNDPDGNGWVLQQSAPAMAHTG